MSSSGKICSNVNCKKPASRKGALFCEACGGTEFTLVEKNSKPKTKITPRKEIEKQLSNALAKLKETEKAYVEMTNRFNRASARGASLDSLQMERDELEYYLHLTELKLQDEQDEVRSLQNDLYQTETFYLGQTLKQLNIADCEINRLNDLLKKGKKKVKKTISILILSAALLIVIILFFLAVMGINKRYEKKVKELSELSQLLDDTRDKNDQITTEKYGLLASYNELSEKYKLLQSKLDSIPTLTISPSPTPVSTPSPSPTPSLTPTPSPTPSPTSTPTPTLSPSPTPTPEPHYIFFVIVSTEPSPTPSPSPSPSPTASPTPSPTPSPSQSPTPTPTPTLTSTPTPIPTPTIKPTSTPIPKPTSTFTPTSRPKTYTGIGEPKPFKAGDTVVGWAITINRNTIGGRVIMYDSPVDGILTDGIINPDTWEIHGETEVSIEDFY